MNRNAWVARGVVIFAMLILLASLAVVYSEQQEREQTQGEMR